MNPSRIDEEPALLEMDVQLTFDDYLRFQYFDAILTMWWAIPFFVLGCCISAVLLVVSAIHQDSYLLRDIIPFTSLLILGAVFVFSGPYFSARRDFAVNSSLRLPIHYVVREHYLQSASPRRTGKLPWSNVRLVRETGASFLIYTTGGTLILPKQAFTSESQMMSLRELLIIILGVARCHFKLDRVSERF
jgi:YcxB-like protein